MGLDGKVKIQAKIIDNFKPFNLSFISHPKAVDFFLENNLNGKIMKVGGKITSKAKWKVIIVEL
ncbi:hypothetical protein ACFVR1_11575 [Psychrobacillus sp. NPDC058041]|uniref:hypothetical protein n=1 Tax=Psychrobacillus sp. NPDC058041 TaxID=3346310 RepID=UPI0036D7AB31